jgi:BolA protein
MEELWARTGKKQENVLLDIAIGASEAVTMGMADSIKRKLSEGFAPEALSVTDESAHHAGHAGARPGGETHFNVRIVSARFQGVSRVERQRQIYAALAAEFAAGLHALSLKALTPEEAGRD